MSPLRSRPCSRPCSRLCPRVSAWPAAAPGALLARPCMSPRVTGSAVAVTSPGAGSVRHDIQLPCPCRPCLGPGRRRRPRAEWFPGIESCTVDGDQRTIVTRSGLPMPEQLLTVDPGCGGSSTGSPPPCSSSTSAPSTSTTSTTARCLVVYSVDAEPAVAGPGHRRRGPCGPRHLPGCWASTRRCGPRPATAPAAADPAPSTPRGAR